MDKIYLIQHLPSGDYDYSEYASPEDAWQAESSEAWVTDKDSLEDARKEFLSTLRTYSYKEVLQAHDENEGWPKSLGYIHD